MIKDKTDTIIAFTTYAKVNDHFRNTLMVRDLHRETDFSITGMKLIKECLSADEYETTEKVTLTTLAQKLSEVGHRPFTVVFTKANGEERTLRGQMVKVETGLGRSEVIDFDLDNNPKKDFDTRVRQVDHRTLKSLIVDNVKYIIKK